MRRVNMATAAILLMFTLVLAGCANEQLTDTSADSSNAAKAETKDESAQTAEQVAGQDSEPTAEPASEQPVSSTAEPTAAPPTDIPVTGPPAATPEPTYKPFVMGFAGDINLTDSYQNMVYLRKSENGLRDCLSSDLLDRMNGVDVMMLNNEFAFSERGKRAPGKDYTFRSKPENVAILKDMGVDIVSLANNHALDFGRDALDDTFTVLGDAGIDYVGAGEDSERASKVIVYENGGKKIGCMAASRVIYQNSWVAGSRSGMQSAYDLKAMLESIKKAKEQCDFLVVYIHWGVEYNDYPEAYQRDWAKKYIDAGANAVVGCHPHVIQGFEIYNGCPIIYSMGNFWFNSAEKYSMYAELTINEDNTSLLCVFPCYNKQCRTYTIDDKAGSKKYIDNLKKLSFNVDIDKRGCVTAVEAAGN